MVICKARLCSSSVSPRKEKKLKELSACMAHSCPIMMRMSLKNPRRKNGIKGMMSAFHKIDDLFLETVAALIRPRTARLIAGIWRSARVTIWKF